MNRYQYWDIFRLRRLDDEEVAVPRGCSERGLLPEDECWGVRMELAVEREKWRKHNQKASEDAAFIRGLPYTLPITLEECLERLE